MLRGHAGIKLAFARLSFNYFLSETVFDYLVDAVHLIAGHGWKLLPFYRFDPATGLWHHRDGARRPRVTLDDLSFAPAALATPRRRSGASRTVRAASLVSAPHEAGAEFRAAGNGRSVR